MEGFQIISEDCKEPGLTSYSCIHHLTQHPALLKRIHCSSASELIAGLLRANAIAAIHHPCWPVVLGVFPDFSQNTLTVVQELWTRKLDIEIERRRALLPGGNYTETELRSILSGWVGALQAAKKKVANRQKLHHTDISPERIVIDDWDVYRITDLESTWRSHSLSLSGVNIAGESLYSSPQIRSWKASNPGTPYDPEKSDVYSIAALILYLQRLFPPKDLFNSSPSKHADKVRGYVGAMVSTGYSVELAKVIESMLQYAESDRPDLAGVQSVLAKPVERIGVIALRKTGVVSYNSEEKGWKVAEYTGLVDVDENTASCCVGERELFACGGGSQPCN